MSASDLSIQVKRDTQQLTVFDDADDKDKVYLVTDQAVVGTGPVAGVTPVQKASESELQAVDSLYGPCAAEKLAKNPEFVRSDRIGEFLEAFHKGGGTIVAPGKTTYFVSAEMRKQELVAVLDKKRANGDDPMREDDR